MIDPNHVLGSPSHRRDRQALEAAWRFQLIAPLLDPRLPWLRRQSLRALVLSEYHDHPWRGKVKVSPRTLRRWCAQYRKFRLSGLAARDRKDLNTSRNLPAGSLEAALQALQEDPRRPIALVVEHLENLNPDWKGKIARSTLDRHLRRVGKPKPESSKGGAYLSFEAAEPLELLQSDIVHGPYIIGDKNQQVRCKIVSWLDDYSRFGCHLEAFPDERFPVIEATLKRTILKHGLPRRVLVDNGACYSCKSFTLACSQLGIQKCHSTPYHPESKGKVEKFQQYLRRTLLNEIENLDPLPLDRINRLLVAWLERYNNRKHSATGMTPLQRYQPLEHRSVSLQNLEEAFWQWALRTVSPQGRIEFSGNLYHADLSLANQKVVIRFDPFDLSRIIIWQDGRKLAEATPKELRYQSRPKKKVETQRKTSSGMSEQYLEALEKAQLERLNQELNLIQLPDEEVEGNE
jgi:putative transposase